MFDIEFPDFIIIFYLILLALHRTETLLPKLTHVAEFTHHQVSLMHQFLCLCLSCQRNRL